MPQNVFCRSILLYIYTYCCKNLANLLWNCKHNKSYVKHIFFFSAHMLVFCILFISSFLWFFFKSQVKRTISAPPLVLKTRYSSFYKCDFAITMFCLLDILHMPRLTIYIGRSFLYYYTMFANIQLWMFAKNRTTKSAWV